MAATFVPVRLPPERLVEAAAVMGRAAVDDPIFVYALPDAEQRAAGVPRMLETVLRIGLKHGEVWVTPPPIAGVACWISPTHPTVTAADRDAAGWREVGAAWGAEAFTRYQAFAADVADVFGPLAAEPHWYLAGSASSRASKGGHRQHLGAARDRSRGSGADKLPTLHIGPTQRADLRASRLPRHPRDDLAAVGSADLGDGAPARSRRRRRRVVKHALDLPYPGIRKSVILGRRPFVNPLNHAPYRPPVTPIGVNHSLTRCGSAAWIGIGGPPCSATPDCTHVSSMSWRGVILPHTRFPQSRSPTRGRAQGIVTESGE